MLYFLISVAGILLTILFVVGTHEYAHFITARLLGVKVLRFSIGFGKVLYKKQDKHGTEYVFSLLPLGGYVKMLDEDEGTVSESDLPYAYNRQPFYKKFLIVLAGPVMNIFCALILYWLIFMIGFTTVRPIIGTIEPGSIAATAKLLPNQEIIRVDNRTTATWSGIIFRLLTHAGNQDYLQVETIDNKKQTQSHRLDLTNWHMSELTPDPLSSLGITPYQPEVPLIIGVIAADSPALSSKLHLGDKILKLNQKPIKNWEELIKAINEHPNETVTFTLKRHNKVIELPVTLGYQRAGIFKKLGYLGISPNFQWPENMLHKIQYPPVRAFARAWQEINDFIYFNLLLFAKLATGKLSLQSLGGPITIFESAGDALNYGFLPFIGFLAFLSISIGVINLFPIPGLDGGHLFLQIIEALIGRRIPNRIILLLYRFGFILLFLVLVQALVNDLLRLA